MQSDLMKQMDELYPSHDYSSRSEFICAAVEFFMGYLNTERAGKYLSETLHAPCKEQLRLLEAQVCKQIFRLAVEVAIASHVSAYQANVGEGMLDQLRMRCIADVKKSYGTVDFNSIYRFQHGLDDQEDE